MTLTLSDTYTYDVTDTRKVLASFAADLDMLARSTGCLMQAEADKYVHDITRFAVLKYLLEVDVTLLAATQAEVRARTFRVSTQANDWTSSDPGGNRWPKTAGGHLRFVLTLSSDWWALSLEARAKVLKDNAFHFDWSVANTDLSHDALQLSGARQYASRGYGMTRTDYQ